MPNHIVFYLRSACPQVDHEWLEGFSQGIYDCCNQFGVALIGGDTTQGPHLTIPSQPWAGLKQEKAVLRSGAKVGDYVCVSGQIGDAAYGLQHLGHSLQQRLDYPTPRCKLGEELKGSPLA